MAPAPVLEIGGVVAAALLWRAYVTARGLSWQQATESPAFRAWVKLCRLLNAHVLPEYVAVDAGGAALPLPSSSPPMAARDGLPRSVGACLTLRPLQLGGLRLRNRVVRAAAYDGESEAEIIQTHVDQAIGGVALTTVAYCCVLPNGRTFDGQLVMSEERRGFLRRLADAVHAHGAAVCAQLTHGGSFADRETIGQQQLAPSAVFNTAGFDYPRAVSTEECEALADAFAAAALLAKETGFDCVELHVGHGYLLSQFLSPALNRRTDRFGGSAAGRAELPAECVRRCRRAVGPDFPVLVKLNAYDAIFGGLELADATVAAHALADASADAIVVTCGNVARSGFHMLRGQVPLEKLVQALPSPTERLAVMVFGPVALPDLEYEDCFLRDQARHILKEVGHKVPVVLLGGVNSLGAMEGAMQEGFSLVQVARALIREPDLVNQMRASLLDAEEQDRAQDRAREPREPREAREARATPPEVVHTPPEEAPQLEASGSREAPRPPQPPQHPQLEVREMEDVVSACIRCNLCVIAAVDPTVASGCPFQRMDAKRRAAQGLPPVLSVEQLRAQRNGDSKERDLRDIEDAVVVRGNPTSSL